MVMTLSKEIRCIRLGDFIQQLDERNRANTLTGKNVRGISVDKVFTPTKARETLPWNIFCDIKISREIHIVFHADIIIRMIMHLQ